MVDTQPRCDICRAAGDGFSAAAALAEWTWSNGKDDSGPVCVWHGLQNWVTITDCFERHHREEFCPFRAKPRLTTVI